MSAVLEETWNQKEKKKKKRERKKQSSRTVHAHRWQVSIPKNFKRTAAQINQIEISRLPPQSHIYGGGCYPHTIFIKILPGNSGGP